MATTVKNYMVSETAINSILAALRAAGIVANS